MKPARLPAGARGYNNPDHHDKAAMPQSPSLKSPRHWPGWLAMALGWAVSKLPYPVQMRIGRLLGDMARLLLPERRRVARINLDLCFPRYSKQQRQALLREHFRSVGMGAMETAICWWGRDTAIRKLSSIEGFEHLQQAAARGKGIILLSAHFTSLELGVRIGQQYLRQLGVETTAMYKPPHDPVVDHVMRTRREAHIGGQSIPYKDVKGFLRALRRGDAVWYAGDQRASRRRGKRVDFFGRPAMTHVAISRLAKMTDAATLPFFTLRRDDGAGYHVIVQPPLDDFPGTDGVTDARRINAIIEAMVRRAPAQYFWLHQRFRIKGANPYAAGAPDA